MCSWDHGETQSWGVPNIALESDQDEEEKASQQNSAPSARASLVPEAPFWSESTGTQGPIYPELCINPILLAFLCVINI